MTLSASVGGVAICTLVVLDSWKQVFGVLLVPLVDNAAVLTRCRRLSSAVDRYGTAIGYDALLNHRQSRQYGDRNAERNVCVGAVVPGD